MKQSSTIQPGQTRNVQVEFNPTLASSAALLLSGQIRSSTAPGNWLSSSAWRVQQLASRVIHVGHSLIRKEQSAEEPQPGHELCVQLPGSGQLRHLDVKRDGTFCHVVDVRLPRLPDGHHSLSVQRESGPDSSPYSLPVFMPRPRVNEAVLILQDPDWEVGDSYAQAHDVHLSEVSRQTTQLIAQLSDPWYIYLTTSDQGSGMWHPSRWPGGLAIQSQYFEKRAAASTVQLIGKILKLYDDELVFSIVMDTSPRGLSVIRALHDLTDVNRNLHRIYLSDTRAVARGVMRQTVVPRELKDLSFATTVSRTIDEARESVFENRPTGFELPDNREVELRPRLTRAIQRRVTQYPLVFCHGMLGYSVLKLRKIDLEDYFVGLKELLTDRGFRVFMPEVGKTHGVDQRAEQLRQSIGRFTREPVNIVAHSMGGLDARSMITHHGMADKVVSLSTIVTPHHGTSFADWFVEGFDQKLPFLRSLEHLGADVDGFRDVTRAGCKAFNVMTPNCPQVRYSSYSAYQVPQKIPASLRRSYAMIAREEGPNDGMVSVESAKWGEHIETLQADHGAVIGECTPETFDHIAFYLRIISDLMRLGF